MGSRNCPVPFTVCNGHLHFRTVVETSPRDQHAEMLGSAHAGKNDAERRSEADSVTPTGEMNGSIRKQQSKGSPRNSPSVFETDVRCSCGFFIVRLDARLGCRRSECARRQAGRNARTKRQGDQHVSRNSLSRTVHAQGACQERSSAGADLCGRRTPLRGCQNRRVHRPHAAPCLHEGLLGKKAPLCSRPFEVSAAADD